MSYAKNGFSGDKAKKSAREASSGKEANRFPDTPKSLLNRIADAPEEESEGDWVRFYELYRTVVQTYARAIGVKTDSEDVAQDVFVKLVEVFRTGAYKPEKGRFRSYLAAIIRNIVINNYYKAEVREAESHVPFDPEWDDNAVVPSTTEAILDAKWRLALRASAIEHVLTRTALSAKSKAIYRAYAIDERPIEEVAAEFDVSRNSVSHVKTRVDRMIADYERLFSE